MSDCSNRLDVIGSEEQVAWVNEEAKRIYLAANRNAPSYFESYLGMLEKEGNARFGAIIDREFAPIIEEIKEKGRKLLRKHSNEPEVSYEERLALKAYTGRG